MCKQKILEVIDILLIDSGITSFLMNYCINDDTKQFDFLIISGDEGIMKLLVDKGSNIYCMPDIRKRPFACFSFLKHFFKNNRYSIVHSHTYQFDRIIFHFAKKYGSGKCISHSHSIQYSSSKLKSLLYQIFSYNLYQFADECLACSEEAGVHLFKAKNRFKIINNAIDTTRFLFNASKRTLLRKKLCLSDCFVVGYVANFCKSKNQKFLIDIWPKILQKDNKAVLLLIGEGDQFEILKYYTLNHNLENNIIFLGKRNDVNDLLFAMDAFAIPSIHEGFSFASLEAQASGLPVVMSEGIPNSVKLLNYVTVSLENQQNWIDTILMMRNYKIDRVAANDFVKKSDFSISKNRCILNSIYEAC